MTPNSAANLHCRVSPVKKNILYKTKSFIKTLSISHYHSRFVPTAPAQPSQAFAYLTPNSLRDTESK